LERTFKCERFALDVWAKVVKSRALFFVFLVCFQLVLLSGFQPVLSFVPEDVDDMLLGVNYYSTHNHYESGYLSDDEIERDFALFRDRGLTYVTLGVNWNYTEPERGEYDETALNDLVRICNFAYAYDLKIIIDFHTLMASDGNWTIPDWVSPRRFETVFTDSTNATRRAWLNFLGNCTEWLNDCDSVWSWNMMNEPARDWGCDVSIDDYLALWGEMRAVFKSYSDRPVSIRFAAQVFDNPVHFGRNSSIYDVCDYLSLNWYQEHCSRQTLADVVAEASEHTNVMISEFGSDAADDVTQAQQMKSQMEFFKTLLLTGCVAWMWRADYDAGWPDLPGTGYNLAKDVDGNPRLAFDYLCDSAFNMFLCVRGLNNNIYYRSYDATEVSWGYWNGLPGVSDNGPASVCFGNQLHMVVRGVNNGELWHGYLNLGSGGFSGWSLLSGSSPSAPTLTSNNTHLCLVVRGQNNIIYYRFYNVGSAVWGDWLAVPSGTTCDSPSAVMINDELHLVVRGMDGLSLWHGVVDTSNSLFSGWACLDGTTPSAPTLTCSESGSEVLLVVRGINNVVYFRSLVDTTWSDWMAIPEGTTCDGVGALCRDNQIHIVVRGMDGYSLWCGAASLDSAIFAGWALLDGATPSRASLSK
jgi:hypothetical protein